MRWLGRSAPLFSVTVTRERMGYTEESTNLFEACRGYPVGNDVLLYHGPRPYLAYRNQHLNRITDTLFVRYDGHRVGKLRLPGHREVRWRPAP